MRTHSPLRPSLRLWRIAAPLAVMALATTGCLKGSPPPASGDAQALLQQVNAVRAAKGLGALAWCPTLANAAAKHTQDMASHGFMNHVGSDGSTFVSRANAHGYRGWTWIAENITAGPGSVDAVMATWMSSSLHAANILNPRANRAGFARVGNYWTQGFGANGTC